MYPMNGMCCAGLMVLGLLAAVGFGLVLVALVVAMLVKRWRKKALDSSAADRLRDDHVPVFQDLLPRRTHPFKIPGLPWSAPTLTRYQYACVRDPTWPQSGGHPDHDVGLPHRGT